MKLSIEQTATAYDEHHVLDNRLTLEWYPQRIARLTQGRSILELGLGHGISTAYFAPRFSRYQVIDGSAEMIARFRERFDIGNVDIVEAYFEDFETDERFDCIVMGFVLEHVEEPGLVLDRYRRFLVPGGAVFVTVPNAESLHRRIGHAAGLLPEIDQLSNVDREFGHRRYFTLDSLKRLATDAGYDVVAAEGLLLKPVTTGQLEKLALSESVLQALLTVGVDYPELCNSLLLKLVPRADGHGG
jgi:ubiquinone/menaquinone biosynthesis C-methylase UbiE